MMTISLAEPSRTACPAGPDLPLAVDLDGTLVRTDLLVEALFVLIRRNPLFLAAMILWLLKGRAYVKKQVASRVRLDAKVLPYHQELLSYLKGQRDLGRVLVLATGSDELAARQVADHLRIFDEVFASDGTDNLSCRRKRDLLVARFGERRFDYAGCGRCDLLVWSSARGAVVVNATPGLRRRIGEVCEIRCSFAAAAGPLVAFLRALRPHQWLKNLLVFVPLLVGGPLEAGALARVFAAFLAFSLGASALYLVNDLIDLPADRRHPHKRERPFASGLLSPLFGVIGSPVLVALAFLAGLLLPPAFLVFLAVYCVLNLAYSLRLKEIALLDVVLLAGLYTLRIMAGSAAISIWPSSWLLSFSTFLFVSLALVKRYGELVTMGIVDGRGAHIRGYRDEDKELLASMGTGSGYLAVLVLVIYISTGMAEIHYTRHYLVWLSCPVLFYWVSYVWLTAHRGKMFDDPLVFTLRDKVSRATIILAAALVLLAR